MNATVAHTQLASLVARRSCSPLAGATGRVATPISAAAGARRRRLLGPRRDAAERRRPGGLHQAQLRARSDRRPPPPRPRARPAAPALPRRRRPRRPAPGQPRSARSTHAPQPRRRRRRDARRLAERPLLRAASTTPGPRRLVRAVRPPSRGASASAASSSSCRPTRGRPTTSRTTTRGTSNPEVHTVDLTRPYIDGGVPPHYHGYDRGFIRWLALHHEQPDFVSDDDLDRLRVAPASSPATTT